MKLITDPIWELAKFTTVGVVIVLMLAIGCGSAESGAGGEAQRVGFQKITDSGVIFNPDQLADVGFKMSKSYDLEGLPGASANIYGFWRIGGEPVDFEIRFYDDHAQAVDFGTSPAEEGSGADAVLDDNEANYTGGIKDRRVVIGAKGGGGSYSSVGPRYGTYAIFGNMVMLCGGAAIEQTIERCGALADALVDADSN